LNENQIIPIINLRKQPFFENQIHKVHNFTLSNNINNKTISKKIIFNVSKEKKLSLNDDSLTINKHITKDIVSNKKHKTSSFDLNCEEQRMKNVLSQANFQLPSISTNRYLSPEKTIDVNEKEKKKSKFNQINLKLQLDSNVKKEIPRNSPQIEPRNPYFNSMKFKKILYENSNYDHNKIYQILSEKGKNKKSRDFFCKIPKYFTKVEDERNIILIDSISNNYYEK